MVQSRRTSPPPLILFEKWMDTTRWLMGVTQNFPKRLRHTMTDRIDGLAITILERLTSAAYSPRPAALLAESDDALARLRVLLRLSHELRVLSHGDYARAAERVDEAGRMLGGWRKKV